MRALSVQDAAFGKGVGSSHKQSRLRKERWMKRQGGWFLQPVNLCWGHAFAASADAAGLAKVVSRLALPVEPCGQRVPQLGPAC